MAGGGPEATVVVIDPLDADSLYLGNYYVHARRIPAKNVIYLELAAEDYADFFENQLETLFGELRHRKIEDRIDFIVMAGASCYRVPAAGLITEPISTCPEEYKRVDFISLSTALATLPYGSAVLASDADEPYGLKTTTPNGYYTETDEAVAFDSTVHWAGGEPTTAPNATRFYIAAMLGYTGPGGNTPAEVIAMIDRSVAADGSWPDGAFYYMETSDDARSRVRDAFFDDAVDSIRVLGGEAFHLQGVLPDGEHGCLGVLTGWAAPDVEDADMTLLGGAYGDHLTSYAALFDEPTHTKVAAWIAKGASGSFGTVEEPCGGQQVAGKFPHPRLFVHYFQGLSLGEAIYRNLAYLPWEGLVYGDPLTQPFAVKPVVEVPDAPSADETVSGILYLTPDAQTSKPGTSIERLDVYLDGNPRASIDAGDVIRLDTTLMPDGAHELRIVAVDDSPVASQGRWIGSFRTDNYGRVVTMNVDPPSGDLWTTFSVNVRAQGAEVAELRLLQNDRVVAASYAGEPRLTVGGATLGAGPVPLRVEVDYADGWSANSAVHVLAIDYGGACCGADGRCQQLSERRCGRLCGGVYGGDGSSCGVSECSPCGTGDFDTNGAVDLRDVAAFQICFLDADDSLRQRDSVDSLDHCLCAFDLDQDSDIDLSDHALVAERLAGPCDVGVDYRDCWTGDFDGDGIVDLGDVAPFQTCFDGTDQPPPDRSSQHDENCLCVFDFDSDGNIDLDDYVVLSARLDTSADPPEVPAAYSYTKLIRGPDPALVELPAVHAPGVPVEYTVVSGPEQAVMTGTGPQRVLRAMALAEGSDALEFQVRQPEGVTEIATVHITYPPYPPPTLNVSVDSVGESGVPVSYTPVDFAGLGHRACPFQARFRNDGSELVLVAPEVLRVSPFVRWVVEGERFPDGQIEVAVPLDRNVKAVVTYLPYRQLRVRANRPGTFIANFSPDITGASGGVSPYDRIYPVDETDVFLNAPAMSGGRSFSHWRADGEDRPDGERFYLVQTMNDDHTVVALYADVPGDADGDLDVDLADLSAFQRCAAAFEESPTDDCLDAFDIDSPPDGVVDLRDWTALHRRHMITGPY